MIEFYIVENFYGFRLIANDNTKKKTLLYLEIKNKNKKFSRYILNKLLIDECCGCDLAYMRPEFMNKIRTWKIKRR